MAGNRSLKDIKDIEMTRDEADEIIMVVEVGFGDHYGITLGQYAEAMLLVAEPVACTCTEDIRNGEVGSICGVHGSI